MNLLQNNVNYEADVFGNTVQQRFLQFLIQFSIYDESSREEIKYYHVEADSMKTNKRTTLYCAYDHVLSFPNCQDLAELIIDQYFRFEPFFCKAVQQFIFKLFADTNPDDVYNLSFTNIKEVNKIRDLRTNCIGKLMSIQGTVTRTTEVRPELVQGNFQCLSCNETVSGVVQQFKYTEPRMCRNVNCGNRSKWELLIGGSVFSDFQKLRVQENPTEIPAGSMPRSIDIILRNEIVDRAKAGDKSTFTGCLVAVPGIFYIQYK